MDNGKVMAAAQRDASDSGGVTLADMERWYDGTHVVWDMLIEQGFAPCTEMRRIDEIGVYPFERRVNFRISATSYERWNVPLFDSSQGVLTLEKLKAAHRLLLFRDCPLYDCEAFDFVQHVVPIARPELLRGEHALMWLEYDGSEAPQLVSENYVTGMCVYAIPGGGQFRTTGRLAERQRYEGRTRMSIVAPPPVEPVERTRAQERRMLQTARPAKRLDGKRKR